MGPHEVIAARRWLLLAVAAIALSALLAILLVLSRTPGVQDYFALEGAFHTVLVLHVNFAVLVWLMSFIAMLWSLQGAAHKPTLNRVGLVLAVLGALVMLLTPLLGQGQAVMSNYIPVIDAPGFFTGLAAFLLGIGCVAWEALRRPPWNALRLAALMWFAALLVWLLHALWLKASGQMHYEALFWGGGHVLQFVYVLALWAVWRWPRTDLPPLSALVAAGLLLVSLWMALVYAPFEADSRNAFTRLMQFGMPLLLLPMFWALLRERRGGHLSLYLSSGLLLLGLLIGVLIRHDTVIVTAHYHATNAAITLAFMGVAYRLLGKLGRGGIDRRLMRAQLGLYAAGMTLYVLGMAGSGWLGVPRKVAMVIEQSPERLSMMLMGLGGVIAILATLMFVSLMLLVLREQEQRLGVKT